MNYFLTLIMILSVMVFGVSAPVVYAGNVVNPIVNAVVTTIKTVVNFAINTVTIVIEAVIITVGSAVGTACEIITVGNSDCGMGDIVNPFINDLGCRNLIGADPHGPGKLCQGGGGSVSGGNVDSLKIFSGSTTPLTTFSSTNALPTCSSITLTGIDASGNNYAVVRDGAVVANLPASQTSYTDTNLSPHTSYEYRIRITNVTANESAPITAYTKCFPQCGFGVLSSSVPKFGTTELSWKCLYNDIAIDGGSCVISDFLGTLRKNVDSSKGSLNVQITDNNEYVLACANKDGVISIPQIVSVFTPGIKEVNP